jgi:hypothetical protein
VLQVNPHSVPSHVAAALVGVGHAVQEAPQELGLVFGWQVPLQSWVPAAQNPWHD